MTQSGQGEEPSPREAREGIVLPSDGGEPLLPGMTGGYGGNGEYGGGQGGYGGPQTGAGHHAPTPGEASGPAAWSGLGHAVGPRAAPGPGPAAGPGLEHARPVVGRPRTVLGRTGRQPAAAGHPGVRCRRVRLSHAAAGPVRLGGRRRLRFFACWAWWRSGVFPVGRRLRFFGWGPAPVIRGHLRFSGLGDGSAAHAAPTAPTRTALLSPRHPCRPPTLTALPPPGRPSRPHRVPLRRPPTRTALLAPRRPCRPQGRAPRTPPSRRPGTACPTPPPARPARWRRSCRPPAAR